MLNQLKHCIQKFEGSLTYGFFEITKDYFVIDGHSIPKATIIKCGDISYQAIEVYNMEYISLDEFYKLLLNQNPELFL